MYRTILDYMGYISDFHQVGRRIYQSGFDLVPGPAVAGRNPCPGIVGSPSSDLCPGTVVVAEAKFEEGKIGHRSHVVDCNLTDRQHWVAASMRWSSNTLEVQNVAEGAQSVAVVYVG